MVEYNHFTEYKQGKPLSYGGPAIAKLLADQCYPLPTNVNFPITDGPSYPCPAETYPNGPATLLAVAAPDQTRSICMFRPGAGPTNYSALDDCLPGAHQEAISIVSKNGTTAPTNFSSAATIKVPSKAALATAALIGCTVLLNILK